MNDEIDLRLDKADWLDAAEAAIRDFCGYGDRITATQRGIDDAITALRRSVAEASPSGGPL